MLPLALFSCDEVSVSPINPSITDLSDQLVSPGQVLVLKGDGLDLSSGFTFNGENITPTSITSSSISIKIPEQATSGKLKIEFPKPEYNTEVYIKVKDSGWEKTMAKQYVRLQFVSSNVGFAMRFDDTQTHRVIDKTINGGTTWTTVYSDDRVSDLSFNAVSENVIWASGNLNAFKKSIDGGTSWDDIPSLDVSYLIDKLVFKNELEGFLLARKSGKSFVFITEDGGDKWTEKLEIADGSSKIDIVYQKGNDLYVLDNGDGDLYKTPDNGENWTTASLVLPVGSNRIINFFNTDKIWLTKGPLSGVSEGLSKSDNGGKDWDTIQLPELADEDDAIVSIKFFTDKKGHLLTSKGGSLYTTDGGESWRLLYIEATSISAVSFYEDKAYIITDGKLLMQAIGQ